MLSEYTQVELRTGIVRTVQTPAPISPEEMRRLVNDLNKDSLVYGCYYYCKEA